MKIIPAQRITEAVSHLCIQANYHLPADVKHCIKKMRAEETWPMAKDSLDKIIDNFNIADRRNTPVCQDTGMACVFLEIGHEVFVEGDINTAVDAGVCQGYDEGFLRKSVVEDPLRRKNTGDNTPALLYIDYVAGDKINITVAPKGFGSENMSRIAMLKPSDGAQGIIDFVVETVDIAGPNPCPPIVVGVGIGGSFDKAAMIAKKALLRSLNDHSQDPYYAEMEAEILARVNSLGIGPQGFGGRTTALAVAIETMPTHIAGLPCAVNINCHVARHASEIIE